MCQQHESSTDDNDNVTTTTNDHEPFPWHLPLYDAHCHPTDTMFSIPSIPHMRLRALTIMATRSQDQTLVSSVAKDLGVTDVKCLQDGEDSCKVVPAFGWHPWLSHQLFDDTAAQPSYDVNKGEGEDEAKKAHYQEVLQPQPEDPAFIDSLPTPRALSDFLNQTEGYLQEHPYAMVGEIGLDKAFRLPQQWSPEDAAQRDEGLTAGGREGRMLSPHRVRMEHQKTVLLKQLNLAGRMGRAVSVHGVQAHGVLYSTLKETWKGHEKEVLSKRQRRQIAPNADDDGASSNSDEPPSSKPATKPTEPPQPKPYPPRICLHSFSGAPEVLTQYLDPTIPADIYFSFSSAVNLSTAAGRSKIKEVLKEVPRDRLLVESDLHRAGEDMDKSVEQIVRVVCESKEWGLEEGVQVLGRNWRRFAFGEE